MNEQPFISAPDPDNPGWLIWKMAVPGLYNDFLGKIIVKRDKNDALVRMVARTKHSNLSNFMHGGAMLGFIDISLFAAMEALTNNMAGYAVTVDLQTQFTSSVALDETIEARISITKETQGLLFMRGTVEQNTTSVAAFTALIKKPREKK